MLLSVIKKVMYYDVLQSFNGCEYGCRGLCMVCMVEKISKDIPVIIRMTNLLKWCHSYLVWLLLGGSICSEMVYCYNTCSLNLFLGGGGGGGEHGCTAAACSLANITTDSASWCFSHNLAL